MAENFLSLGSPSTQLLQGVCFSEAVSRASAFCEVEDPVLFRVIPSFPGDLTAKLNLGIAHLHLHQMQVSSGENTFSRLLTMTNENGFFQTSLTPEDGGLSRF